MLAVIRHYERVTPSAARSIIDARAQIEALLQAVPGTHQAFLVRTRDGLALIALGPDEWGLAECGRRFRAWADAHIAEFQGAGDAAIWSGEVIGTSGASSVSSGGTPDHADPTR